VKLPPVQIPPRPAGLRIEGFAVDHPRFNADANTGLIEIFDSIGDQGTTPARISAALRGIGAKRAVVEINSPGGDVFAGLTIFNQLRAHTAGVTTRVLGLAASAASVVAMAGDTIEMARASQLMIHRAQGIAVGDVDAMRQVMAVLDQVDGVMADVYASRSALPREQIIAMMREETFVTAEEAVGLGLADALIARDATPPPGLSASSAPASKRALEDGLRQMGLSRSAAGRAAGAAWATMRGTVDADADADPESEIDLNAIAKVIAQNVAALTPRQSR
jgi:ATP-dependent protease ClpP protease subunit